MIAFRSTQIPFWLLKLHFLLLIQFFYILQEMQKPTEFSVFLRFVQKVKTDPVAISFV
jgi:hypothetical protein